MNIKNIKLETNQNIRNFESFKTHDNKKIIKNALLRSNNLYDFTNKDIVTDQNNIRRIQKSVANFYKISFEDMKSKKRTPNLAIPRQVAMYLSRSMLNESFERIGLEFGGKDHTTVMHSCNKIEKDLNSGNIELKKTIEKIKENIS